ncbi:NlpC/P60 family protein [Amycolatopsis thermoflava]|uniref:NlpC/P60 family protein n=2 Tax=Pseudonocardiaceae TaxID=2070 RepID=A0A3N2GR61_9PSEU|nr:NlpC/P60 family protein [Amycolatopsis thermoflava]
MPTRIRRMIAIPITCAIATAALLGFTAPAGATQLSTGDRIVNAAAAQAGTPYRSGGETPGGFDCSGLTQYAHKQVGIDLPRTARDQRAAVRSVSKSDMRPGDLVFFSSGGSVYHVGIYAGNNKIWAAPESGDTVRLQNIWTSSYSVGRAW